MIPIRNSAGCRRSRTRAAGDVCEGGERPSRSREIPGRVRESMARTFSVVEVTGTNAMRRYVMAAGLSRREAGEVREAACPRSRCRSSAAATSRAATSAAGSVRRVWRAGTLWSRARAQHRSKGRTPAGRSLRLARICDATSGRATTFATLTKQAPAVRGRRGSQPLFGRVPIVLPRPAPAVAGRRGTGQEVASTAATGRRETGRRVGPRGDRWGARMLRRAGWVGRRVLGCGRPGCGAR